MAAGGHLRVLVVLGDVGKGLSGKLRRAEAAVEEPLAEGLLAALIERRVGETRVSVSVRGSETVKTFVV